MHRTCYTTFFKYLMDNDIPFSMDAALDWLEKLFYGNGIRMVIAGVLAGRIVFFQLICQTEKGFRHSAPAEKAVFRTAERTFDIPKKQVMLKAEQGISILGTRLVGNFQFLSRIYAGSGVSQTPIRWESGKERI